MPQQAPEPEEVVEIRALGHAGDGVTDEGLFVPFTLPGDIVRIEREGNRARLLQLISPGPSRIAPPCPHFGRCGGCALQHVERALYLKWKRDLVVTALRQRGFNDVTVDDIHAVPPGTRRRANFKAQRTTSGVQLGFYEAQSRILVDLRDCPVLVPELAALLPPLRKQLINVLQANQSAELLATATDSGIDIDLKLKAARSADLLSALSQFGAALKLARLSWNGDEVAVTQQPSMRVGRFSVALPPDAFLQPTREGERFLQEAVMSSVGKARRVADLFCGCGTFALGLADAPVVHAVDSVQAQVEALGAAAKRGNGKVTTEVRDLFRRPLLPAELARFDAVVLDPPRPGAAEQAKALAKSEVPGVLYVSCNAASFARDARILADGGYRLVSVRPLDQFVWSPHVELFAEFSR